MAGDLEAFLRQAAERRLAQKRAAQGKREAARPAPQAPVSRSTPMPPETPPAEESVAEHVARHINTSEMEESTREMQQDARELGQAVLAEEADFESRLESVFDHRLGTVSGETTAATTIGERSKKERAETRNFLIQLFRNKTRLREAIVLSEILQPPPGLRD